VEAQGRVLQVSLSAGGVPKLPVAGAWIRRLGVDGDAHHEHTVHGGPHRAVCLFSIEAIERLQAEGHPVEPGSVGENLTTSGIEWSTLPVGTRARVGADAMLEIASSTTPCETQRPNFRDGRFSRINIALHPTDSRMYARVLEEGYVKPGDPIELLPPAPDSRAHIEALLARIDRPAKSSSLKLWAAARKAGFDVRVLDDGDIGAGASPQLPEPAFNHAYGLRMMPQLLPRILRHYARAGTTGLIPYAAPDAQAQPEVVLAVHACVVDRLPATDRGSDGVEVLAVGATGREAWIETYVQRLDSARDEWRALLPHLLAERDVYAFLGCLAGDPVGVGLLNTRHGAALLGGGFVVPRARHHGVHQALIRARVDKAVELGCDVVASTAPVGSTSARNLARAGLPQLDTFPMYKFVPPA
jgi:MOSC domain-containing protein YiiM/GNAT superfamily N-acetyltransferase